MTNNKPDHNKVEIEKQFLLKALITKICEERTVPELRYPKEFFGENHLLIKKLLGRKKDLPSVKYLEDTFKFESVKCDYTITDIISKLNGIYYFQSSQNILKELINERKSTLDYEDAIVSLDNLSRKFADVRGVLTFAEVVDIGNDTDKVVDDYKKLLEDISFVDTGFKYIDDVCRPRVGNSLLLIGSSGKGKSMLMTLMQRHAMRNNIPSLYISLEMSLSEQIGRLLLSEGLVDPDKLRSCELTPEEYREAVEKLKKTNTYLLTIDTESRINLQTIERYISEVKPKLVLLDYMTLLQGADLSWNAQTSLSAELKRIALQYKVLMVTAAQADTSVIQAGDIPEMHQTRGNKAYCHDFNIVIGFDSERYMIDPDNFKYRFAIRKNRNGGLMEFAYKIRPNDGLMVDISNTLQAGM